MAKELSVETAAIGRWYVGKEFEKLTNKKALASLGTSKADKDQYTVFNTSQDTKAPYLALRTKPTSGKSAKTIAQMADGTIVQKLKGKNTKKGSWIKVKMLLGVEVDVEGWCNAFWLKPGDADGYSTKPTHEVFNTSKDTKAPYLALRTFPTSGAGSKTAPAKTIAKMPDGTKVFRFEGPGSKKGKWVKIQILSSPEVDQIGLAGWAHSKWLKSISGDKAIISGDIYKIIVRNVDKTDKKITKESLKALESSIEEEAIHIILSNVSKLNKKKIDENPLGIKEALKPSIDITSEYDISTSNPTQISHLVIFKYGEKEKKLIKEAENFVPPEKITPVTKEYRLFEHIDNVKKLETIVSQVVEKIRNSEREKGPYAFDFRAIVSNAKVYSQYIESLEDPFQNAVDQGVKEFDLSNPTLKGSYKKYVSDYDGGDISDDFEIYIKYSFSVPETRKPEIELLEVRYNEPSEENKIKTSIKDGATHQVANTSKDTKAPYLALRTKPSGATGAAAKKKNVKTVAKMPDGTRIKQLKSKKGKPISKGNWIKAQIVDLNSGDKGLEGWASQGGNFLTKVESSEVELWRPWKDPSLVVLGLDIKKHLDPYFVNLIFNIQDIMSIDPNSITETIAEEFVEKYFIKPSLTRFEAPEEAKRVYNSGKINYKNETDLERETLSDEIKNKIHKRLLLKYNNVADQAFLSMLKDVASIKTLEDIYEKVLNAIPTTELIKMVAECLMKAIPLPDIKRMICDSVFSVLSQDDLNKLLSYLGTSNSEVAQKIKTKIDQLIIEKGGFNDQIGSLISESITNLEEKDVLCAAVLAAIPAAIALLATMTDQDLEKLGRDLLTNKILNPAQDFLITLQKRIDQYSITGITDGWKTLIEQLIDSFIEEFIVKTTQQILQELAYLCEGSSKSDLSGMGKASDLPQSINGFPPTFPYQPFDLTEAIDATDNDEAYNDIIDALLDEDISPELIKEFLDDLTSLLTVSEICTLLNEDSNSINRDYILNKVWSFLSSEEKYKVLVSKLGNISQLRQLFYLLSLRLDLDYCVQQTRALDATKKVLADICGPISNDDYIDRLNDKAAQEVIDDLLNKEDAIASGLLDNLLNFTDPSRITAQLPPLFCGPETQVNSKPPLFLSHQHDSEKYLAEKIIKQTLSGIEKQFEQDISFFKGIFLAPTNELTKVIGDANSFKNAMASIYSLAELVKGISPPENPEAFYNTLTEKGTFIAQSVYDLLVSAANTITVSGQTNEDFLRIFAQPSITDDTQLSLNFNYGDDVQVTSGQIEVEPKTSKMIVNIVDEELDSDLSDDPYNNFANNVINSFGSGEYDQEIKSTVVDGLEFYGFLLKTIIIEHAEYITQQDLFKRANFDKLQLNKEICTKSILFGDDILEKTQEYTDMLECKKDFTSVPLVFEIVQINMYVQILIRLVLIEEMLKSIFVFATFNIDSLLPENNIESFYYRYLSSQVDKRLYGFSEFETVNYNISQVIAKYSTQVYAATQNLDIKADISQDEEMFMKTKEWLFAEAFLAVRNEFAEKLKESNLFTPATSDAVLEEEFIADGDAPSFEVLTNIISPKRYNPPTIKDLDYKNKKIIVGKGTYSSDQRLVNGGFFVETGYKIVPKLSYDASPLVNEEFPGLLLTIADVVALAPAKNHPYRQLFNIFNLNALTKDVENLYFNVTKKSVKEKLVDTEDVQYFNNIGNISSDSYGIAFPTSPLNADYLLEQHTQLQKQTALNVGFPEDLLGQLEVALSENKVFKQYTDYYSLNLLLRVDDPAGIMFEKYNQLVNKIVELELGDLPLLNEFVSFHDSILDKKYFIQEEDGPLYFKLPILVYYPFEENNSGLSDLGKINVLASEFSDAVDDEVSQSLKEDIATQVLFKDLIKVINYKDILSYLSMIITETLEQQYPKLSTVFDKSFLTTLSALTPLLANAERDINPNYYQEDATSQIDASDPSADWLPLIMKEFLKTIANMVDPTWKTPWFAPGPFTPFGIAAKVLDGEMGENDPANTAGPALIKTTSLEDADCLDSDKKE